MDKILIVRMIAEPFALRFQDGYELQVKPRYTGTFSIVAVKDGAVQMSYELDESVMKTRIKYLSSKHGKFKRVRLQNMIASMNTNANRLTVLGNEAHIVNLVTTYLRDWQYWGFEAVCNQHKGKMTPFIINLDCPPAIDDIVRTFAIHRCNIVVMLLHFDVTSYVGHANAIVGNTKGDFFLFEPNGGSAYEMDRKRNDNLQRFWKTFRVAVRFSAKHGYVSLGPSTSNIRMFKEGDKWEIVDGADFFGDNAWNVHNHYANELKYLQGPTKLHGFSTGYTKLFEQEFNGSQQIQAQFYNKYGIDDQGYCVTWSLMFIYYFLKHSPAHTDIEVYLELQKTLCGDGNSSLAIARLAHFCRVMYILLKPGIRKSYMAQYPPSVSARALPYSTWHKPKTSNSVLYVNRHGQIRM